MNEADLSQVKSQLKAVGVGSVGMRTPEVKEIAKILHSNERIGGVIFGRYTNGLAWLIATDKRMLFIDKKTFFTTTDELTYDVVSGVRSSTAGGFASIILHTRVSDYTLRYVNPKCARIFIQYIEKRRLEGGRYDPASGRHEQNDIVTPSFHKDTTREGLQFLRENDLAVLSTVDRTGNVHGAIVHYILGGNDSVYILTKSGTEKGRNVYAHSQIALTIHKPGTLKTLQLQGTAEVETNQEIKNTVFENISKPRLYENEIQLPPVTKLQDGSFMIIKITPTQIRFNDYSKSE